MPMEDRLAMAVRALDSALWFGRHLMLVMSLFVLLSVAIAAYCFAMGNALGGVISSLFVLGGVLVLAKMYSWRSRSRRYRRKARREDTAQRHRDAASA